MAEFLWTFAVQETLKKVVKVAASKISVAWGLEDDLSNLTKWLLDAGAILRDVDREKLHNESVRRWVDDLQDIVGEAEDLLDELAYEDLRRRMETTRVCNLTFPSIINPLDRLDMAKKMKEITKVLEEQYRNSAPLGLVGKESIRKENEGNLKQIRETTSILNFDVVGRETEVLDVLKLVIDSSNDEHPLSIIPIVGMGGVGKTTLAKLVFRHELIKKHFHETIWVCVSERFDIDEILVAILESLTDKVPTKRETLLRRLQKELRDKRYFLVLDDVWNENSKLWDEFENCLKEIAGKFGSTIMVTTRIDEVANIMGTVSTYRLEKLSEDQCWSLFKGSAKANGVKITPKLEAIRKELLKKIDGIPLVAKVLGGAVEFQGDINRWETTLASIVRKIPMKQKSFVLSILQLSVDHLPFLEKQCFAYCSNFPKDYEFVKENLIQMWIAQEFIQPQEEEENITMEDIGEEYFNFLLSRSLFQDVIKDKYGRITHFKMHDLIHDVAFAISNSQKSLLDPISWSGKTARKMRTLIFNNQEIHDKFADCVCLRVLEVNYFQINNLPDLIGKLKYLRYLDISKRPMTKLTKYIVMLYNLQTLKLGCIESLPKNLRKLVSLRHLEFYYHHNTKQMPSHMSELIHLQTLSEFVAGFEKGCKIEELGDLKNLKGQLQLSNLELVKSKEEAMGAKLVEKKNLCELSFEWSIDFLRECSNQNDLEVLEGLQPHKDLRSLKITNFGGKFMPNATFVENLVFLCLYGCTKCERLPMLGQLPNLKELGICFMDSVRGIGGEFYGNDSNQRDYFPKLKKLDFSWMCNLEQWEEVTNVSSNHFGSLQTLKFDRCGKLTKLPNGLECCNSVQDVMICNCPNLILNVQNMHNLSLLSIAGLKQLPEGLAHLPNLKTMMITGCMKDYDYSPFVHLSSLTKLYLNAGLLRHAARLPRQLEHLTALKILGIENFDGIETLPEWLGNLTSLETLDVVNCKSLKELPSREAMLRLTKLNHLKIMRCPLLLLGQIKLEGAKRSHLPKDCVHVY